jgi:hypothetical protein
VPAPDHAASLSALEISVSVAFLRFAHRDAADAKKPALLGCFGNVLADLAQPALEGGRVAGRLGIDYRANLPQRLDALGFDWEQTYASGTRMILRRKASDAVAL